MKSDGAAAVVREKEVRWTRNPESMTSCSRWSGLANLKRKMREDRSYILLTRSETSDLESS